MADTAKVASIEALEAFRSSLVLYLEAARRTLDEISEEVTRTRIWLQADRRLHWSNEARRRARDLENKQQTLFSAKIGNLRESAQELKMAVDRARRALGEAEQKLEHIKQWSRQYDNRVEPSARDVDKLRSILDVDMGHALAFLDGAVTALSDYAGLRVPGTAPAPTATESDPAAGGTGSPETPSPPSA